MWLKQCMNQSCYANTVCSDDTWLIHTHIGKRKLVETFYHITLFQINFYLYSRFLNTVTKCFKRNKKRGVRNSLRRSYRILPDLSLSKAQLLSVLSCNLETTRRDAATDLKERPGT